MNKPEWRISDGAVPYAEALTVMEQRVADIRAGRERELVWLLTSALHCGHRQPRDLLQPMRFQPCRVPRPIHLSRPASVVWPCSTLHPPPMRRFVSDLEECTIRTLGRQRPPSAAPAGSASG
jgi:lipoyl(octanoyl) transferase